jgi:hypothetical protein
MGLETSSDRSEDLSENKQTDAWHDSYSLTLSLEAGPSSTQRSVPG